MSDDEGEDEYDNFMTMKYKLVFVGDSFVGKTTIMNRFITGSFNEEYDVIYFFFHNFLFLFRQL